MAGTLPAARIARAFVQGGLAAFRYRQRYAAPEPEEILHVDGSDDERQQARGERHPRQVAEQLEQVEPGRHEGEIHDPRHQHEDAADGEHAGTILLVDQHRQQEQQHEERAGIEGVEPGDQRCHQRQRIAVEGDLAKEGYAERGRRQGAGCVERTAGPRFGAAGIELGQ
ncbi:MAG: hypothetical protein ACLGG6_08075 [Gammaproteobacteria bacterium]